MVSFVLEQFNFGARTIFIGGAKFPKGVFRGAVYPKDIWHGDATYPRIFTGGGVGGRGAKNWECRISYDTGCKHYDFTWNINNLSYRQS